MNETSSSTQANMGFVILISLIATIGGFLFGYDSGVINGTVDGLQKAFNSNSMGTGFSVSSMLLGCAVGAFFAGQWADKYGRWWVLMVSSVLFIISAWGSGIATGSVEFIIYRVIGGLAVGAASIICPAYISEVAPAQYRGKLSSIQQIAIISGLFFSFLSNYFLADSAGGSTAIFWGGYETWRWMFWMELIPAGLFFLALFLIPESPRFLVASGKNDKAKAVLAKLYGNKADDKVKEIYDTLAHDHKPSFRDLVNKATGKIRPIVWIGFGLAVLQQFVGINVVFYYGAVLWQAAGFSESDALLTNVLSGAVSIGACFITFFLVDKVGRKPLLWVGSIGMTITLALVAFAFAGAPVDEAGKLQLSSGNGLLALIAANVYVVFFNMSWGPVVWIMLGEMFPNQMRGSALAIAGLAQWGANFLITWTFPMLLASAIGLAGAYSIYTFFSLFSVFFVMWYIKETKGKELEQMEG
ncbi:MFS transporter [Cellvibrio sp. KY-GH-1]|uniref:sugar porter family MFS transporter n=1 Tax=Cellvibrio sp. KY-GH-1 TaxID=2303332 RepID=UPI001244FC74|nr:sugar porter family MFS transporter [Cellvibrio sp. KY-GH-1]QEY18182.1 MFS transporter [Cellvibrio sp. KY-GH-1]